MVNRARRPVYMWMKRALAFSLGCGLGAAIGAGWARLSPRYHGPVTGHFDGRHFHNSGRPSPRNFGALIRWMRTRDPGPWRDWVDDPPGVPPPRVVGRGDMRVTFVNHATALVQMDGINVLTDPIWSERASPVTFAGPKRARPPGIRFEDLPPIDVVVVSHNHYDHLDVPTLARLVRERRPRIIVPLGNGATLERAGIQGAEELDWWQSVEIAPGVKLVAVPSRHFSSRSPFDFDEALWAGFVVEGPSGRAFFAGDTGYGEHFREIAERLGAPRVALLPIGAFRPRWFMGPVHMAPWEAVQALRDLRAGTGMAIHYGTFQLADDGEDEPTRDLARALETAPGTRFWVLGFGEGRDVPALE